MTSIDDAPARADFAGVQALSSRGAGYAVALRCLQVQGAAESRDPSLNTAAGVRLHEDAWPWFTGAVGEIEVGRMLEMLGPGWFVRHSVPIGTGTKDVDHLVIGPGGVFAINTKHHRGASIWVGDHVLRVNNANTPHLKIAQGDGIDVARRLQNKVDFPVTVVSVIAVLNSRSLLDRRLPENRRVWVVDARHLVDWLLAQPHRLDDAILGTITAAAEEPETWHFDPRAADTLRVIQRFERLVAQVNSRQAPAVSRSRVTRAPSNRPPARRGFPNQSSRTRGKKAKAGDILMLWFVTGMIIVGLLLLRGNADQPCTSVVGCVIPSLYLALKPLLVLGGVVTLSGGIIGTVVMSARIVRG